MSNFYLKVSSLSERVAKLSPEKYQLLEKLLRQDWESSESNKQCLREELYNIEWRLNPINQPKNTKVVSHPNSWLIFADRQQQVGEKLAELLEKNGDQCIVVFPGQTYEKVSATNYIINPLEPQDCHYLLKDISKNNQPFCDSVVHLWSLDDTKGEETSLTQLQEVKQKGCASILHLVQALIQVSEHCSPRLWLVTQGAKSLPSSPEPLQVQQSALWGLGQVINLEHPDLKCTNIDWGTVCQREDIEALYEELKAADKEHQIIWRGGNRFVARLVRQIPNPSVQSLTLSENGTYLITGGLGALGLKLADWLAKQGARNLVLMGRSVASTEAQTMISQLEQAGAKVSIISSDVSNSDDVTRMLEEVKKTLPPLRGIIHAAGVIDDGTLRQLSWKNFDKVMAAKIDGSWNLHKQTQDLSLDFFVCFSSMTSLVGNAGQANYAAANAFMDELAHHRQALGLPGLTINWGPWAEVGMAAQLGKDPQTGNLMAAKGIGKINPVQGLKMLGELMAQGFIQMGVMPIDWSKFLDQFSPGNYPRLFCDLTQEIQEKSSSSITDIPKSVILKDQLKEVDTEQRETLLTAYLQNLVSKFLGLSASNLPKIHQPLNEIGMDSLVSIQLRNRLTNELDIELPMRKLMGDITIAQVVEAIQEQLSLGDLLISQTPSLEEGKEEEEEMEEFTL